MATHVEYNPRFESVQKLNLRERFGQQYQVSHEESYCADKGRGSKIYERDLQIIRCKHGHIFVWDDERLAASTNIRGEIANQLRSLDCCEVEQDGDDGINVSFHVDDFDRIASIIQPRRRRKLYPERRAALAEA